MKIVQINAVCGLGSTGRICTAVAELLDERNIENYIIFSSGKSDRSCDIKCANKVYTKYQALKSRILGSYGFNSVMQTKRMIWKLEEIQPDIVHLHNIHGHDCHLRLLFDYFRKRDIKLFWTFHDCWAFTGYCPHFTFVRCNKWKQECTQCPQRHSFSLFTDRSSELHHQKKVCFSDLNLTIVTPSKWMMNLVQESFLKDYPVKLIYNGIDLNVFKPTPSNFRKQYGIPESKKILLGVAYGWSIRKGLDVFVELSRRLDHKEYQIVLVGTDEKVDQQLPDSIISIHRTNNQKELAGIYTAADLFVNPTREEVLGLVNIESLACGTPVITFRTGGSPEILDERSGCVVDCDDVDAMEMAIKHMCENRPFSQEACMKRAQAYEQQDRFYEYVTLYEEIRRR